MIMARKKYLHQEKSAIVYIRARWLLGAASLLAFIRQLKATAFIIVYYRILRHNRFGWGKTQMI
jgi:hypothetical protein